MNATDILTLLLVFAGLWYWMDSIQVKHLACAAGRRECEKSDVEFLDDTVVLIQVRLRRNAYGKVMIRRVFRFEFTSDEHNRFHGEVIMLGNRVERVRLEPYSLP